MPRRSHFNEVCELSLTEEAHYIRQHGKRMVKYASRLEAFDKKLVTSKDALERKLEKVFTDEQRERFEKMRARYRRASGRIRGQHIDDETLRKLAHLRAEHKKQISRFLEREGIDGGALKRAHGKRTRSIARWLARLDQAPIPTETTD